MQVEGLSGPLSWAVSVRAFQGDSARIESAPLPELE